MLEPFNKSFSPKPKWHGHFAPHIGPVYLEMGYYGGMYVHGDDPLIEVSALHYVNLGWDKYFTIINIRIWRIVFSVSLDLFRRKHVN